MDLDHHVLEIVVAGGARQVLEADLQVVAALRHAGQDLVGAAGIERLDRMEDRGVQEAERGAVEEDRLAGIGVGRLAVLGHEAEIMR